MFVWMLNVYADVVLMHSCLGLSAPDQPSPALFQTSSTGMAQGEAE